ncbi:transcriptional regulator containing an amidase domain and an AraC-type DNA-binding HTH domain [Desulfosporosinus orientis DSM 765]|uniref:Transcriptional regulator containing an amidase domain and an AraC-type DNA-binding HTH domain n=1 Tax=Desulfosporosinus orientis (strain ATCC 19365 / DSM 765 / NCIMB 8382 / VKM B-1628 / Singapore I) TaxID=768706 RepID=G7WFE0_DESOD|nr:type 1 glutamine amidotransferase family protein [Desulfosporosinus orientis]AET68026.1 transcriptional regulator containing an amidase domain and an AraC-type DNA-binding HTH domain [Desulfosporosinus orientis DSM 765]
MKKVVLFVILDKYADWEAAYLSSLILSLGQDDYSVKTVSLTKDIIQSIGGFTVLPDYDIQSAPTDFEGLILIGGMSWRNEAAQQVKPLVQNAFNNRKVLGGICDASAFLGTLGVLNKVNHTSNDLNDLKQWAGNAYTGEEKYIMQQAVRDNNIITANGTASLEFAKEVMLALGAAPENRILELYNFHKLGYYGAPMPSM